MEEKEVWYTELFNDLKKLEHSIILQKWKIGQRISRDILKFKKQEYGSKTLENLAEDLKVSTSHLYHCIAFYKKFTNYNDIIKLENYSWFYIVHNILPENPRKTQENKGNEEKQQVPNETTQKFISEKIDLWKKGDLNFKKAIEQECKEKIKLYKLILKTIQNEKYSQNEGVENGNKF